MCQRTLGYAKRAIISTIMLHARTSECKKVRASDSINSEMQKGGFEGVPKQSREDKGSS